MATFKSLNVTLDQINTTTNIQIGAPSLILDTIGVDNCPFGEIVTVIQPIPSLKLLWGGLISELKVTILDDNGRVINNNGLPVTVVLQIVKHEHLWRISYHNRC